MVRGSSHDHWSVQLANLLAGAAGSVAKSGTGNPMSAVRMATVSRLLVFVGQSVIA
ncbi:hypothetical protein ACFYYR_25040 [Streptomyces sp. NPDC001922]|uniref:hypothetical protein n=1 Tax=Streptomyces sp. NPDC001922 TaxID=3364624 RepID=UPI003680577D